MNESEFSYAFDFDPQNKPIIKVIGVGGGGSNAVNFMYDQGIKDVDFVIVNTDHQALRQSAVPNKIQIGSKMTEGLGAGANPERGRDAALESEDDIREMLSDNTKMVFVTAGMGGGTGTGAAPVIARIAKELGILTVGIVTAPFSFEGPRRRKEAEAGIEEMKRVCDSVLIILNDKLREIFGDLKMSAAFAQADNVLSTGAKGIAEIITLHGVVNVDFEDVKTVIQNAGTAVMGMAITNGEHRAIKAAEESLASPLLNNRNINGAQKILVSLVTSSEHELRLAELEKIMDYLQSNAGGSADVILGHGIDQSMDENLRMTVIATGFDKSEEEVDFGNVKVIDLDRSALSPTIVLSTQPVPAVHSGPASPHQITRIQTGTPATTQPQQASQAPTPQFVEATAQFSPPQQNTSNTQQQQGNPFQAPLAGPTGLPAMGQQLPLFSNPLSSDAFHNQQLHAQQQYEQEQYQLQQQQQLAKTNQPGYYAQPTDQQNHNQNPGHNLEQPQQRPQTANSQPQAPFNPPASLPLPQRRPLHTSSQPMPSTSGSGLSSPDNVLELQRKRQQLIEESMERANRIQRTGRPDNAYPLDNYEKPAYLRQNIPLTDIPSSEQANISRYALNEEELVSNNKFLHDNVD
jgi:cell division protein FtsZ